MDVGTGIALAAAIMGGAWVVERSLKFASQFQYPPRQEAAPPRVPAEEYVRAAQRLERQALQHAGTHPVLARDERKAAEKLYALAKERAAEPVSGDPAMTYGAEVPPCPNHGYDHCTYRDRVAIGAQEPVAVAVPSPTALPPLERKTITATAAEYFKAAEKLEREALEAELGGRFRLAQHSRVQAAELYAKARAAERRDAAFAAALRQGVERKRWTGG